MQANLNLRWHTDRKSNSRNSCQSHTSVCLQKLNHKIQIAGNLSNNKSSLQLSVSFFEGPPSWWMLRGHQTGFFNKKEQKQNTRFGGCPILQEPSQLPTHHPTCVFFFLPFVCVFLSSVFVGGGRGWSGPQHQRAPAPRLRPRWRRRRPWRPGGPGRPPP